MFSSDFLIFFPQTVPKPQHSFSNYNLTISNVYKIMQLEIIILSEVSQKVKYIWDHLHVESKKITQMNLSMKQKQDHTEGTD